MNVSVQLAGRFREMSNFDKEIIMNDIERFTEKKADDYENLYKRALADYQNLVKQTAKEKIEFDSN